MILSGKMQRIDALNNPDPDRQYKATLNHVHRLLTPPTSLAPLPADRVRRLSMCFSSHSPSGMRPTSWKGGEHPYCFLDSMHSRNLLLESRARLLLNTLGRGKVPIF